MGILNDLYVGMVNDLYEGIVNDLGGQWFSGRTLEGKF